MTLSVLTSTKSEIVPELIVAVPSVKEPAVTSPNVVIVFPVDAPVVIKAPCNWLEAVISVAFIFVAVKLATLLSVICPLISTILELVPILILAPVISTVVVPFNFELSEDKSKVAPALTSILLFVELIVMLFPDKSNLVLASISTVAASIVITLAAEIFTPTPSESIKI